MRALARQAQLLASFRDALRERAATRIDLPPEYVEALEIVMQQEGITLGAWWRGAGDDDGLRRRR